VTDAAEVVKGPRKKHRHDLGQEDHGPAIAGGPTRAIQALLGLWIVLTVGLVIYTLVEMSGPAHPAEPRSAPTAPR
jgi:hypothetical protein